LDQTMRNGFRSSSVKQIFKNQKDRESLPGPFSYSSVSHPKRDYLE
jgi:hypothetical protein